MRTNQILGIIFFAMLISTQAVQGQDTAQPLHPGEGEEGLLYIWDSDLKFKNFSDDTTTSIDVPLNGLIEAVQQNLPYDVYDLMDSPLSTPPADDYGFHHGIYSPQRAHFVHLELQSGGHGYRVRWLSQDSGNHQTIIEDTISPDRGYLDPIGWTQAGDLVLVERYVLDRLWSINIWTYDFQSQTLGQTASINLSDPIYGHGFALSGQASVFVGMDVENQQAKMIDLNTNTLSSLSVDLSLVEPLPPEQSQPPILVLGVLAQSDITALETSVTAQSVTTASQRPAPFMYWPFSDHLRGISKFPDSNWTAHNGMPTYGGHQGTDFSYAFGTPILASAPGTVIYTYTGCADPSYIQQKTCPDGDYGTHNWGNSIWLSHNINNNGNNQTWYTMYGHARRGSIKLPVGSPVSVGDKIAEIGTTGYSFGYHLHLEIRNNSWGGTGNGYIYWDDPWGSSDYPYGKSLWVGGNGRPTSAEQHDVTPPTIVTFAPGNGVTNVSLNYSPWMRLSETVRAGSGQVTIYGAQPDGSGPYTVFERIDVSNLQFSGTQVTINPTNNFQPGTTYIITASSTAIEDEAGNTLDWPSWRFSTVPQTEFQIANGNVNGLITAIETANSSGAWTTIELASGGTYQFSTSYANSFALPEITGRVIIQANGATLKPASWAGDMGFLAVDDGGTASLFEATISGFGDLDGQGAVNNSGSMGIYRSEFVNNKSETRIGFGVVSSRNEASIFISATRFENNQGRVLYIQHNTGATISHSDFVNNSDGALSVSGNLAISYSDFVQNSIAITSYDDISITNSTFISNQYGALDLRGYSNTSVSDSTFQYNTGVYGSAIDNQGVLQLGSGNLFEDNTATSLGGAIYNSGTMTIAEDNRFIANHAQTYGGAIYNTQEASLTIDNSTLVDNSASQGGAIYNSQGASLTINDSCLVANAAPTAPSIFATTTVDAAFNWWGSSHGPKNTITSNVAYYPWQQFKPADCPLGDMDYDGSIAGQVMDETGTSGVGDVRVSAYNSEFGYIAMICTQPDGRYNFDNVPLAIDITVAAGGPSGLCEASQFFYQEFWQESSNEGTRQPIALASNLPNVSGIDLTLTSTITLADMDVNNDSYITPTDALYVINRMNGDDLSADVNGDKIVNQVDVDLVMEHMGETAP